MADCMEHCSRYWGDGEGCYGVVWREDEKCWIRNSNTTVSGVVESTDGTHSALVGPDTYDKIDTACPGADLSTHTIDGLPGLGYTLQCDKVIAGFTTCWSGDPKPCWDAQHLGGFFVGFFHTKTLDECVRICAGQSPLCKAVSWNPDYSIGFANCWPKTGWSDNALATPSAKNGVIHSVTITSVDRIDTDCPSQSTYTTTSNRRFDVHCGQLNEGTNITQVHTQNMTACMDSCATTDKCVGVVFDSTLQNGFNNCYLQNTTSTISEKASASFAALLASSIPSSTPEHPNSGSASSDSESKAWIAGPVVGGLAGLAILAGAFLWWRRRQKSTATAREKHGGVQYDTAPQQTGYYDAHMVNEADPEATRSEMPATTKYAHHTGEGALHEAP